MKIIFNIKHLVAVFCLLSATFAYSSFELPPLKTDDEKLAFLLQVRKEIPKLFVDAAKYDIDLFTLLDNEAELVNLLKKYARFDKLYSDKKYLNISVKPTGNIWVGEVKIKPEAINAWKDSILEKIQIAQSDFSKPQDLLTGINTKDILISDPLETLNKIKFIKINKKDKLINDDGEQNNQFAICKRIPQMIEKFQCIRNNYDKINKLPNLPSKEDIDGIIKGIPLEEKVFPQFYLAAVLKKNQNTPVPQDWDQFKNSIGQLNGEDLIYLNDRDEVLKPILLTYFDGEKDKRLLRVLDFIHKKINKYASDTISHKTLVTSEVELVQVRPEIGIFRGCIGGDCSSRYSFPYPNDPHERVFYIKTKKLKGYVSTTEVMVGEEKALYVITISGANVSAENVELILRGFEKAKETLGVKHIILPTLDNLVGLINFPAIKAAYENHIKKSTRSVELVYQDKEIRDEIEKYKPDSRYNTGSYDHSDKNKNGWVLSIKNNPVDVNIAERLVSQDNPFSKEDFFESIKELRISGRKAMIDKVLNTQTTETAFGKDGISVINSLFLLLDSCTAPDVLSIHEFKTNINDRLRKLGLGEDYLERNSNLMVPGYLKCQDAFSKNNLEEAAMLTANDIKNHEDESLLFPLIKSHIVELNTTSAFKKLNEHYYEKLSNPDVETRKAAIRVFSKTKPTDPKIHRAVVKALGGKVFSKIKPTDPEIHRALVKALGDDDWEVAEAAANALGYIKPTEPEVHKALAQALGDDDGLIRYAVAEALESIKPTNQEVLCEIANLLQHKNSDVRQKAAKVLGNIESTDPEIHKALAKALGDDDSSVRQAAAEALGNIKPTDQVVLLEIAKLLQHENADIRAKATEVLKKIKTADAE